MTTEATDWARPVQLKIERAFQHINDLHLQVRAFFDSEPYSVVCEPKPETRQKVFRLRVREEPPPSFALIAGDAVHNLRSALDILICQLVRFNLKDVNDTHGFPIGRSRAHFESGAPRKIDAAGKEAKRLVRDLKPYREGNDALWRLHRLDIVDKHRLLVTVGTSYEGFGLTYPTQVDDPEGVLETDPEMLAEMRRVIQGVMLRPAERFPLKDGHELLTVPEDHDENEQTFRFDIALDEPDLVAGEPLIPALVELAEYVAGMVGPFLALFDRR